MGRFLPLVLVILSVAAPARGQAGVPPDADRLMSRGIELHQAGDILGAIDAYKAPLTYASVSTTKRSSSTRRRCRATH